MSTVNRPVPKPNGFAHTAPFWQAARDRKLMLQYCPESRRFQHVPRPVSIYTGKRNLEWREVTGKGHIYALTTLQVGRPEITVRLPLIVATIELDEGVRIIGNLIESDPQSCKIGRRVELAWDFLDEGMPYPAFRISDESR